MAVENLHKDAQVEFEKHRNELSTHHRDIYEMNLPLDPKRGFQRMSLQMNKITSEEDYLGIGWTAPLEHQFFDFV